MHTQGGGVHQLWRVEWDERERCEHSLRAYECSGPKLITGGRSGRCTLLSSYTWCMYICMNCAWLKCIFYLVRTTCDGRQWRHLRYWAITRSHSSNLWELSRPGKSTLCCRGRCMCLWYSIVHVVLFLISFRIKLSYSVIHTHTNSVFPPPPASLLTYVLTIYLPDYH